MQSHEGTKERKIEENHLTIADQGTQNLQEVKLQWKL